MREFWVSLVALFIAVAALGMSIYTFCIENAHYEELTRPHTLHNEVFDKLSRLDNKIDRIDKELRYKDNVESQVLESLTEAKRVRDEAEMAWVNGDYEASDKLIKDAYDIVNKITTGLGWWLYIVLTACTFFLGMGGWLFYRMRKKPESNV